ncbi:hypothetical protein, partial [Pedobacter changchengzhani]|uniref:hypothetical protein n=1 Tax=Pedobacter changchengzhani TaxID=2529274 RepID=UPI001A9F4450
MAEAKSYYLLNKGIKQFLRHFLENLVVYNMQPLLLALKFWFKPVFYGFYKKKGNYFLRSIILDMPSEFLLCNHLCKIWGSSF